MLCTDQAGLRRRIEDLLSEEVGFERLSTVDQAEALIAVAVDLLDCRGGAAGRDHAVLRGHELVEWCRDRGARAVSTDGSLIAAAESAGGSCRSTGRGSAAR